MYDLILTMVAGKQCRLDVIRLIYTKHASFDTSDPSYRQIGGVDGPDSHRLDNAGYDNHLSWQVEKSLRF